MSFSATIPVALQQFLKNIWIIQVRCIFRSRVINPKIEHVLIPCQKELWRKADGAVSDLYTICMSDFRQHENARKCCRMMRDAGYRHRAARDLTPRERTKAMKDLVNIQKSYGSDGYRCARYWYWRDFSCDFIGISKGAGLLYSSKYVPDAGRDICYAPV